MRKLLIVSAAALAILATRPAHADLVEKAGVVTYAVHDDGAEVSGDYYGSGPDDAFAEYGVTTFNFSAADFGFQVAEVLSATLSLTVNDRGFSDGTEVEFFITPDDGSQLDGGTGSDFGALVYDTNFGPNGINPGQFVDGPVSLGVFTIEPTDANRAGEIDSFNLDLSDSLVQQWMTDSINSGSDFQVLIGARNDNDDITYSGVGNTFDPGDPSLAINASAVPEPSSVVALCGLGLAGFGYRRLRRRRTNK